MIADWLLHAGHHTAHAYRRKRQYRAAWRTVGVAYLSILLHLIPGVRQWLLQRRARIMSNWWANTRRQWWPMTKYIWFYGKCP